MKRKRPVGHGAFHGLSIQPDPGSAARTPQQTGSSSSQISGGGSAVNGQVHGRNYISRLLTRQGFYGFKVQGTYLLFRLTSNCHGPGLSKSQSALHLII
jgi:hypothetical protein